MRIKTHLLGVLFFLFGMSMAVSQNFEGNLTLQSSIAQHLATVQIKGSEVLLKEGTRTANPSQKITIHFGENQFDLSTATSAHLKVLRFNIAENPKGELMNPLAPLPDPVPNYGKVSFQKTQEKKVLEGWNCQKYIGETEKSLVEVWVTQEVNIPANQVSVIALLAGISDRELPAEIPGTPIQFSSKSKENGSTFSLSMNPVASKIDSGLFAREKNAKVINLSEMRKRIQEADNDPEKLKAILSEFE